MLKRIYFSKIQDRFKTIDWKLLLFLILFLNVKLVVKLVAIALIYLLQFNFKFDFKIRNSRLPIFYLAVIVIAIFNLILTAGFTNINYTIAFLTGTFFWTLCILAMHQLKLCVEQSSEAVIHRTIIAYFLLNALISISTYVIIVIKKIFCWNS